jgi:hypothetical protein
MRPAKRGNRLIVKYQSTKQPINSKLRQHPVSRRHAEQICWRYGYGRGARDHRDRIRDDRSPLDGSREAESVRFQARHESSRSDRPASGHPDSTISARYDRTFACDVAIATCPHGLPGESPLARHNLYALRRALTQAERRRVTFATGVDQALTDYQRGSTTMPLSLPFN